MTKKEIEREAYKHALELADKLEETNKLCMEKDPSFRGVKPFLSRKEFIKKTTDNFIDIIYKRELRKRGPVV